MACCSRPAQKWWIFGTALGLLILGVVVASTWGTVYKNIKNNQLSLKSNSTQGYNMWKKTPIPMYIEFYLFNLTNAEEYKKDPENVKPILQECGPYTFKEEHTREQVQFNNNYTLTYKTNRIWHFLPDKTNGSLNDSIVIINPILMAIGQIVKNYHILVQEAIDLIMKEEGTTFFVKYTVNEYIFEGYDDKMIDLVKKLNITKFNYPYDKFGWFYNRNGSVDYDGTFTMYTGEDDINKAGRFTLWNGRDHTDYYGEYCNKVNGTSGEYWYPLEDSTEIQVFSPDICSTLSLTRQSEYELHGIAGYRYAGEAKNFDNGSTYPEVQCFSSEQPSGTRDVSKCKYGAPAFVSYPHYLYADESYREAIIGMNPNKSIHEFAICLEPETGVPLRVDAAMQLNLFVPKVRGITLLAHIKELYMPLLWFRQSAELTENLASEIKLVLILPSIVSYTSYGIIGLAVLIGAIGAFITFKRGWENGESTRLLNQETL